MAFNASGRGSRGEMISHFGGVRLRVNGTGILNMQFAGLDGALTSTLLPITMSVTPGREPFRLANFVNQRATFKGWTENIDEIFEINRIVLFPKELWAEYPGIE